MNTSKFCGFCVLLIFVVAQNAHGANILGWFPFPSRSHHILGSTLLKELTRRGHNVTMVSPFPFEEKIPNYTDVKLESLFAIKEEMMKHGGYNRSALQIFKDAMETVPRVGEAIFSEDSVQNLLKSDSKFDVVIVFQLFGEMFFGLSHRFNAPLIVFNPMGSNSALNSLTGNLSPYSYVPVMMVPFTEDMTFYQRVVNTLVGCMFEFFFAFVMTPQQQRLTEKYFPDAPPLSELKNNVAIALVNSHPSTESARPYTPNIIQIGGFHVEASDPLPAALQTYLDSAKEGVIYFSFGTNINIGQLSAEQIAIFMKCFAKLKQKILWKVELDDLPGKPSNVRLEKWLPQKSILAHPNVKVFITHGGKGSVVESTRAGVPMLAIPLFGDQPQNVAEVTSAKYALSLELNTLTEDNLMETLTEILNNPMYRDNVRRKSELLMDQPIKPMDNAVYWVEHVIKHKGANHLKPASLKLNIFQQLLLDVIAFIVVLLLVALLIFYYTIKGIFKLACYGKNMFKRRNKKEKTS